MKQRSGAAASGSIGMNRYAVQRMSCVAGCDIGWGLSDSGREDTAVREGGVNWDFSDHCAAFSRRSI